MTQCTYPAEFWWRLYIMKFSIRDRVAVPTMVSTMGCGEVVSNRPARALAMAEIDIWINPSSDEAVAAM